MKGYVELIAELMERVEKLEKEVKELKETKSSTVYNAMLEQVRIQQGLTKKS